MKPLSLRAGRNFDGPAMHFAHPRDPDHQCPYKSENTLTPEEIERMVYNGVKESRLHRLMKVWLRRSLVADSEVDRDSIHLERRFAARLPDASYRRPDVAAQWRGQPLVFEAQLTSTFVTVIAQRAAFYRREGATLLWVFANWPPSTERYAHKDLYYNNNYNVLVVNETTCEASIAAGRFLLDVWWPQLDSIDEEGKATEWEAARVALADLVFDEENGGRAFYRDVEGLLKARQRRHRAALNSFGGHYSRDHVSRILLNYMGMPDTDLDERTDLHDWVRSALQNESNWQFFANAATDAGLLARPYDQGDHIRSGYCLMTALYALYTNVISAPWKNFRELENHVHCNYRQHYGLFLLAVHEFDRRAALNANDTGSTFISHVNQYRVSLARDRQERAFDSLVVFLFPQLKQSVNTLQRRQYRRLTSFV